MDLSEFVKTVLVSVNNAVDQAREETTRDIHFSFNSSSRTVEFDVAITAEQSKTAKGKAGVKVLQFVEAGGDVSSQKVNSTVSRVKFGVDIEPLTKDEASKLEAQVQTSYESPNFFS